MSNINLVTGNVPQKKIKSVGKGMVITTLGLILVISLYLTLSFINKKVTAQIMDTKDQYKLEYNKFLTSNASEALDFNDRSNLAQELMKKNKSTENIFSQLEKDILPQVYLTNYDYDAVKGEIKLECSGDTFQNVAKQIVSLKEDSYFKQVSLGDSVLNTDNRIKFTINLKLK